MCPHSPPHSMHGNHFGLKGNLFGLTQLWRGGGITKGVGKRHRFPSPCITHSPPNAAPPPIPAMHSVWPLDNLFGFLRTETKKVTKKNVQPFWSRFWTQISYKKLPLETSNFYCGPKRSGKLWCKFSWPLKMWRPLWSGKGHKSRPIRDQKGHFFLLGMFKFYI